MDAFTMGAAAGLGLESLTPRQVFRLSWHFGLFQFIMPVTGWLIGQGLAVWLASYGAWIAFALLGIVGSRMIVEALTPGQGKLDKRDPTKGLTMVLLSLTTSIDALAVGVSLALIHVSVWHPAMVIGSVALMMTGCGMIFGRRLGVKVGYRLEILGGLIMIGIGIKVLASHLW